MQILVWIFAECPKRFLMEVKSIFPDIAPENVLIVPTCQKSVLDLASFGEDVDKEKDELLEKVENCQLCTVELNPIGSSTEDGVDH